MWEIISAHVDFEDMQVLDLGCGYGDFVWRAANEGAYVTAVEKDIVIADIAYEQVSKILWPTEYAIIVDDIDRIVDEDDSLYKGYDIIMCTSVLPYLSNVDLTLHWIRNNCDVAIIECQYSGDGPGLESAGFGSIEAIGRTDVKIRPAYRTIWRCAYDE
jgi:2-polyprenyl-3-methyl-5-hydroxy-6-metoxy-1,4-benzoquinol methylase